MEKNNDGKISIANVLAVAGIAAIGVVTFFGEMLHSGGNVAGPLFWAIAVVAILGFLLFLSIKAKGAEDNVDKWVFVEWGSVACYAVAAILCSTAFLRFFYVKSIDDTLQASAKSELAAIKKIRKDYEVQQKQFLNNAVQQIINYQLSSQKGGKDELAQYVSGIGSNMDSWAQKATTITQLRANAALVDIEKRIETWSLYDLSALAADLETQDLSVISDIETHIAHYQENNKLIPVIVGGGSVPYRMAGYAEFKFESAPQAKFAKMMKEIDGQTTLGWVLYIALNLLVLLNYLVAGRTHIVGPSQNAGSTGGLDL